MKISTFLSKLFRIPFHPILFGIYPVLALYYFNREETLFFSIWRALTFSLAISVLLYILARIFFKKWEKAALAASLVVLLFFTYGHVYNMIENISVGGVILGRHRYFLPFWFGLLVLIMVLIKTERFNTQGVTNTLNTIALTLIVVVLVQMVWFSLNAQMIKLPKSSTNEQLEGSSTFQNNPDVYYIILDSYGRQDVLKDIYNLDNSDFIHQLESIGFIIPECTQSNYSDTMFSLSSSLNMEYLDGLGFSVDAPVKITVTDLLPHIKKSEVRHIFEQMGYATITFKSVYPYLDITDSTYFYNYFEHAGGAGEIETLSFYYLFLRTTAIRPLMEYAESRQNLEKNLPGNLSNWIPSANLLSSRNFRQYQQNGYLLASLEKIPDLPGKKFVYAHLFITHQPFVFTPKGDFRGSVIDDDQGYRDQILFADKRIIEIVRKIIINSKEPPVIVIQGDHSYPHSKARVKILNAYYFPNDGNKKLYPEITPVNTFRLIFDTYFGGNYELLKDVSFYSEDKSPTEFIPLPTSCIRGY